MDVLTIHVQDETDERAACVLAGLADMRKLSGFLDAIFEKRDLWTVICRLEDDLLAFNDKNRYCGALDDWKFVVGHCPFLLENVPEYLGYGDDLQAWLVFEDEWVLTVIPPDIRQGENTDDVLVWDLDSFMEHDALPLASTAFADDSGIKFNRAMREIREMDALLGGSSG